MQIKSYFKCDLDLHRETVFLNTSDSISEGFFLYFFSSHAACMMLEIYADFMRV